MHGIRMHFVTFSEHPSRGRGQVDSFIARGKIAAQGRLFHQCASGCRGCGWGIGVGKYAQGCCIPLMH